MDSSPIEYACNYFCPCPLALTADLLQAGAPLSLLLMATASLGLYALSTKRALLVAEARCDRAEQRASKAESALKTASESGSLSLSGYHFVHR